jgi:hypothetical protein
MEVPLQSLLRHVAPPGHELAGLNGEGVPQVKPPRGRDGCAVLPPICAAHVQNKKE